MILLRGLHENPAFMFWTLSILSRHFFRRRTARILLLAFAFMLIWWAAFVPEEQGHRAAGVVGSWPRWLAYAWLLLHGSRRLGLPHQEARERLLSWSSLCIGLEMLLALCSGEMILLVLALVGPFGFHVEPPAVLLNVLLASSACLLSLGLRAWGRIHELGLWVMLGLMELAILRSQRLQERGVTFVTALALFLCAVGLLALSQGAQSIRKSLGEKVHRCM
ncbi:MAG: hypothetical protein ACE5F1_09765 [Planctomycetota bacterium]